MKQKQLLLVMLFPLTVILGFQNCSQQQFQTQDEVQAASLKLGEDDYFKTKEDTELSAELRSVAKLTLRKGRFELLGSPKYGQMLDFSSETGAFRYQPAQDYYGQDSFSFSEIVDDEPAPIIREAKITVEPANDRPWIEAGGFEFEMNTSNNVIEAVGKDLEDPSPTLHLSASGDNPQLETAGGSVKKVGDNLFHYTPKFGFRGADSVRIFVRDRDGDVSYKDITVVIGNPFRDVQPSMAVRGMGCITCHAKIDSPVITDFGFGDRFFFGKNALAEGKSVFHGSATMNQIYSDHDSGSWITASFKEKILLPNASLGVDLKTQVRKDAEGKPVHDINHARYRATTVQEYVDAIEADKRAKGKTAASTEVKKKIFIGSPDAATLAQKTSLGSDPYKYFKNSDSSPTLSELQDRGEFFSLSGEVSCDGDLTLSKPLLIKDLKLSTIYGCRVYSGGAVFIEGAIAYKSLEATKNMTNLQILSSQTIVMGIGPRHCETTSGWYFQNNKDNDPAKWTPMKLRFSHHLPEMRRLAQNQKADYWKNLEALAEKMQVKDSSCGAGSNPRDVHFDRLLLVAPDIQSRYTGQFNGVIIAEFANFGLSKFSFKFDEVFKSVPVLPLLDSTDYLSVE